ncbi:MAG TPA: SDR family oxidoreductase [Gemmatimonadales bacterium]|jgi:NAD(P)-dependent dehydrogenase (short-subunit alcohol dehydrogenase family)
MTPLEGKTIVVTGASRGIGAATAVEASRLGATVIRLARSPMPSLAGAIDLAVDLADGHARADAFRAIVDRHGVPDGVVSAAGTFVVASIEETDDATLRRQLELNVEAAFALARHFLPLMRARGQGTHVLIGSVADHRAFAGNAAYAASKHAVRGMHDVLCEEFRGTGVRCTLISPGPTDTTIWDPVDPDHNPGFTPRSRMLRPADVAAAVLFALLAPPHVQLESIRLGPV